MDGKILYVGDKTLKVFGYNKSELLGKKVDILFNYKDLLEAISQAKEYSSIVLFRTKQKCLYRSGCCTDGQREFYIYR